MGDAVKLALIDGNGVGVYSPVSVGILAGISVVTQVNVSVTLRSRTKVHTHHPTKSPEQSAPNVGFHSSLCRNMSAIAFKRENLRGASIMITYSFALVNQELLAAILSHVSPLDTRCQSVQSEG